jgi:transcription initiation factor TFIIB
MNGVGQSNVVEQNFCILCLGELLWDQENGEKVCTKCGAVTAGSSDLMARVSLARGSYDQGGNSGAGPLTDGIGVATTIGPIDVDAGGKRLGQSRDLKQLRRMNTIVTWDSKKRRLGKVSMEVRRISQALGFSTVVAERAFEIYLKEFNAKSVRARSLVAVAAASVCMACRELEIARPANDVIAQKADVDEKKFRYYYRMLLGNETSKTIPSPSGYISAVAAKASLQGTTERMAIEILSKVKGDPRLVGKRPVSLAAAALYLASMKNGDRTTQLRLAYAAGVTPITIRKRSVEISSILGSPS